MPSKYCGTGQNAQSDSQKLLQSEACENGYRSGPQGSEQIDLPFPFADHEKANQESCSAGNYIDQYGTYLTDENAVFQGGGSIYKQAVVDV